MEGQVSDRRIYRKGVKNKRKKVENMRTIESIFFGSISWH